MGIKIILYALLCTGYITLGKEKEEFGNDVLSDITSDITSATPVSEGRLMALENVTEELQQIAMNSAANMWMLDTKQKESANRILELESRDDHLRVLVQQLMSRLDAVENENRELEMQNEALHALADNIQEQLNTSYAALSGQIHASELQLRGHTKKLDALSNATSFLAQHLHQAHEHIKRLQQDTAQLEQALEALGLTVDQLNNRLEYVIETLNTRNGFVATLSVYAALVRAGETVPFDTLLYNQGGGFDSRTSTYICQSNGFYLFSTSLVNFFHWDKLRASIVLDGIAISAAAHADSYAREWNQGSVTAVCACTQGQRVWVRSESLARVHGAEEGSGIWFSQFVGVLLQPDL